MEKNIAKKIFSVIFLFIFLLKMVISAAPLIISHFDKQAVNAVIMQLEIESNGKTNDIKESAVKEYFTLGNFGLALSYPIHLPVSSILTVDHDKHLQSFYPPIPTPPPNV